MISVFLESLAASLCVLVVSFLIATKSEATPLAENTIYVVKEGQTIPLVVPQKAFWNLKNDKTERPGVGETESFVEKKDGHVTMKGFLASLPGNWGRVGFSLIETAITKPVHKTTGLRFRVQGTDSLWASVLVKDRQANQPEGTLTFQWDFELKPETTEFEAPWSEFVPTIRGKMVSGFELDLFSVKALAFQVSRSQQKKWYETAPLEFELKL
ncbi:MAG: hypothetical protein EBQ92_08035 [Proteobacteria bacterium]|nr:hypothetical protein [Pseudomonadota bacterium]